MASDPRVGTEKAAPTTAWRVSPSNKISIVPRAKWAKLKIRGNVTPMGTVRKITVHHTDDSPSLNKISDVQFLKSMENHHRNVRKWACIGYHFIIGRDGKIYEGRPAAYQGAHVSSNNSNNLGISLIGDFNKGMPNKAQLNSLKGLLAKLRQKHKIPASRVYGHGHLGKTQCPGKHLKKWLEVYRSQ